jgi:hypothetical protein
MARAGPINPAPKTAIFKFFTEHILYPSHYKSMPEFKGLDKG